MSYSHLELLSPELILAIMRKLDTFYDLNSLVRTSKFIGLVFESNPYGVCGAIARNQFRDVWDDASNLLRHGQRLCRFKPSSSLGRTSVDSLLSPIFLHPQSSSTNDDKQHPHGHGECCGKPVGKGILSGGVGIGLAEAKMLMKFVKRSEEWRDLVLKHIFAEKSWKQVRQGIRVSDVPIPNVCSITTQESVRIDRALLRYYLLLLACAPDWVIERTNYHLLFLNYKPFPSPAPSGEDDGRAGMTRDEIIESKRRRIEPFIRYRGRDLSDLYVVGRATAGCYSQLPGTMDQGADHIYERWSNIDDACVQQEADIHIKRVWRNTSGPEDLLSPDMFFEECEV